MKLNSNEQLPTIPTRQGLGIKESTLDSMESKGTNGGAYPVNVGDVVEFPDTVDDVRIVEREVRAGVNGQPAPTEALLLVRKNNKLSYLSISNLRRRDSKMQPVHPVAQELHACENDKERIIKCLGRTITATESVTYNEAIFDNGVRTDKTRERTVAKLIFQ